METTMPIREGRGRERRKRRQPSQNQNRNPMLQMKFRPGEKEAWQNSPRKTAQKQSPMQPPKSRGRHKGGKGKVSRRQSRPSVKFSNTPVGHFLYVYAPLEYHILMRYKEEGNHISYGLIESVALQSDNRAFATVRFRKALISFRRFGHRPRNKVRWSLTDVLHFAKHSFHIYETLKQCTE